VHRGKYIVTVDARQVREEIGDWRIGIGNNLQSPFANLRLKRKTPFVGAPRSTDANLLRLLVRMAGAAVFAVLLQFETLFDRLLVLLRLVRHALARRAFELGECFL
jgi:hypothetical protein